MPTDVTQILTPFGFTSLESEIYTFLLRESPATGYRVAQAIGKAAANTYKAIESLQQKGAVLVEEGANRSCRAVPSDELLARLTRDFEWRRAEAELHLANISNPNSDDRVYTLRSRAQIIERARHMLGNAQSVALIACSAHSAHPLLDAFASCSRRGVDLSIISPERLDVAAVQRTKANLLDEIRLVFDGSEYLCALFKHGKEDAVQAIWTSSPYLAICAHRGLAAEFSELGVNVRPAESTSGYAGL